MNDEIRLTLAKIEARWEVAAGQAVTLKIKENPSQQYYAAGFWLFYLDGVQISPPLMGINPESGVSENGDNRWDPANWREQGMIDVYDAMQPLYFELSAQLEGKDWHVWVGVDELHRQTIARICRNLTNAIRTGSAPFDSLPPQPKFVFGIFEGRDSQEELERLARLSIEPEILDSLNIQYMQ